jgi:shikimate kinase
MTRHILLVGMMGAGKTTVGELVAHSLGWPYRDSDLDVAAATGMSVPEIFRTQGEPAFRRAESEALARACAGTEPSVISVAGGAVLAAANRELLRASGTVVWLRAGTETLAARVGTGVGRPLLDNDPAATLAELSLVRARFYADVADVVIDVDDLSAAEVATIVVERAAA